MMLVCAKTVVTNLETVTKFSAHRYFKQEARRLATGNNTRRLTELLSRSMAHIARTLNICHKFPVTSVYTSINTLQCRTAFWSRKDKGESPKEQEPADIGFAVKRKAVPGEDKHAVERLNVLKLKSKLTNKRPYQPPADVDMRAEKVTRQTCDLQFGDWCSVPLADPKLKYKVLTTFIKEFDHDIPNAAMSSMKTVEDAVNYFKTEVRDTTPVENMSKLDLPKNLHIQMEYQRFDPETDTMFGGRTAFPGHDTIVSSIKYRRKYKSIKTRKEKPGFVNHYYGY